MVRWLAKLRLQVVDGGGTASLIVPSALGLGCKTDVHGVFALRGVPPGRYTLEVWDEALGSKSVPVTVPFTAWPLRIVFGSEQPLAPRGAQACTIALRGDSPIARACASGGRDAAKKVMKGLVKDARSRGAQFTCESCHQNLESFALTASARDDLEKMLASAQQAH